MLQNSYGCKLLKSHTAGSQRAVALNDGH